MKCKDDSEYGIHVKVSAFWHITPCGLVKLGRLSGRTSPSSSGSMNKQSKELT
jgi:hypothetical protein